MSNATTQAVFAGGCFWCTEAVFEQLRGVSDVTSGYCGGSADTADYESVCTGRTGHAEAVKITYDPNVVSYEKLLEVFFATHDPTTKNRQGPDIGPQYRSAIFYTDDDQKDRAEKFIKALNDSGSFGAPIVTTLEPLEQFHPAEAYHQDFARQNPDHPYVCQSSWPKVAKAREKFPDLIAD
ncbi:MAG: peptide-methionine (S)-S-oxide reductase MsrA [Phycisphaeraceae bacterium]|nr:peptide-methionine (S)-S-oxide reductase MsrA [Phycisphaeraceae bacterium]